MGLALRLHSDADAARVAAAAPREPRHAERRAARRVRRLLVGVRRRAALQFEDAREAEGLVRGRAARDPAADQAGAPRVRRRVVRRARPPIHTRIVFKHKSAEAFLSAKQFSRFGLLRSQRIYFSGTVEVGHVQSLKKVRVAPTPKGSLKNLLARLSGRSVQKQNRSYRITRYYYGGAPARSRATTSPPDAQRTMGSADRKSVV